MDIGGEARMKAGERRFALRARTSERHAELDGMIGAFDSLDDYRRYLQGQYAFRAGVEEAFAAVAFPGGWQPTRTVDAMRADFADLRWQPVQPLPAPAFSTMDEWLGAAYVLQGASLGAQLLLRRAPALGLFATHGARHLAAQAGALENWRRCLALLDEQSPFDIDRAAEAARMTFARAIQAARREQAVAETGEGVA